jgi:hypothetical protein
VGVVLLVMIILFFKDAPRGRIEFSNYDAKGLFFLLLSMALLLLLLLLLSLLLLLMIVMETFSLIRSIYNNSSLCKRNPGIPEGHPGHPASQECRLRYTGVHCRLILRRLVLSVTITFY